MSSVPRSGSVAGRWFRARRADVGVPPVLMVPALLGMLLLLLPLIGLLVRTPWNELPGLLMAEHVRAALRLSMITATAATGVAVVLGVPVAWLLARSELPGRRILRGLVTVPLVLPPVVGGIALLVAFGRRGVVGSWLEQAFGVSIPFTTVAVVMAQTFVAMPFLIVAVEGALLSADSRYDQVAASLGASPWTTFRRVTLPSVAPGVLAGAVLCWARALGEFGATITFAGSFPGITRTLPLEAYVAVGAGDTDTAIVLSLIMVAVCVVVLVALRGRWVRGT